MTYLRRKWIMPIYIDPAIKLSGSLNNRRIAMRVNKHQIRNANWHLWSASPEDTLLYSAQSNLASINLKWLFSITLII